MWFSRNFSLFSQMSSEIFDIKLIPNDTFYACVNDSFMQPLKLTDQELKAALATYGYRYDIKLKI